MSERHVLFRTFLLRVGRCRSDFFEVEPRAGLPRLPAAADRLFDEPQELEKKDKIAVPAIIKRL